MNMGYKSLVGVVLLWFITAAGVAYAGPFGGRFREGGDSFRAERQQRAARQDEERAQQSQEEGRRLFPASPAAPVGNAGASGPAIGRMNELSRPGPTYIFPNGRRIAPRMTIEERQRLRRQINEAGQDIYAPNK